jgi:arylsulfatase A-like enzyme
MDWLPTFAALAGALAPADRQIDGLNLTPLLFGDEADFKAREAFYYYRGFSLEAVRSGSWKLHLHNGELYDLEKDIGEARNLAAEEAEVVKRLRSLADAMDKDLGREGATAPGIRPLGRVAEAQPLIGLDGQIRSDANARVKVLP